MKKNWIHKIMSNTNHTSYKIMRSSTHTHCVTNCGYAEEVRGQQQGKWKRENETLNRKMYAWQWHHSQLTNTFTLL